MAKILIVRLGAMGDILHALPAVTGIRAAMPEKGAIQTVRGLGYQFVWGVKEVSNARHPLCKSTRALPELGQLLLNALIPRLIDHQ